MSHEHVIAVVGAVAAVSTTVSFLPQLVKVRRQGGRDLSWGTLATLLVGGLLWLTYGGLTGDGPVIAANLVVVSVVGAICLEKRRHDRAAAEVARQTVAIDMDEVMADALGEHLRRYNARFGTALAPGDLAGHLEDHVPAERRAEALGLVDASFFEHLEVMPGAQAVVRELTDRYDVIVATAAMEVPCSFDPKYRWLRRHFPFIPPSNIVFCGDKRFVGADYLIDDQPRQLARFAGRPLLFSAPHNAHETRFPRANGWADVRTLLLGQPRPLPRAWPWRGADDRFAAVSRGRRGRATA